MDLGLHGKVALVCAASSGLGKAAALALAEEGTNIAICSRDRSRIEETATQIREALGGDSPSVLPVMADVSNPEDIKRFVASSVEAFGQADILVTNAGGPPSGSFPDLSDEQWKSGFDLNLMSTVRCIREVIPLMQKSKWGRIINITSLTVKQPASDLIISSVLRPGIIGLSKVLANLYGRDGITVNSVAPGFIMTARQQELGRLRAGKKGISFEEYVRTSSADIPAGRFGTPDELASVIAFLASKRASYINGATISVDGGLVKGLF